MKKIIKGDVDLGNLCLTELFDLSDVEVMGSFACHSNYLTSLEGAPKLVRGKFLCHFSYLTSLSGAPETVGGDFNSSNNKLKSLIGAPHTVGASFHCYGNDLTSLEGIPKKIGYGASFDGDFWISNKLRDRFPEKYIRSLSDIKGYVTYL